MVHFRLEQVNDDEGSALGVTDDLHKWLKIISVLPDVNKKV